MHTTRRRQGRAQGALEDIQKSATSQLSSRSRQEEAARHLPDLLFWEHRRPSTTLWTPTSHDARRAHTRTLSSASRRASTTGWTRNAPRPARLDPPSPRLALTRPRGHRSMSTAPAYEIITVPAVGQPGREELRQQCYDVRIAVFHREQGFPLDTEIDESSTSHLSSFVILSARYDEEATHILLRLLPDRTPVGTIRCTRLKHYYKLSRLAVLKEYRKYRFGAALVQSLHDHVKADARASGLAGSDAAAKVIAHSQIPVKGFYAKFGYVPEGEEFDEDGAPHQKMVARLSLSD
ncbi:hypothetical protein ACG7TL_004039 [Trametes sanguinea]